MYNEDCALHVQCSQLQLARVVVRVLVLVDVVCVMLVVLIALMDVVHAVDTVFVAIFCSRRCTLHKDPTFRTNTSDLELEFDSHSSPPMSESVPTYENSLDSIPADKVLRKRGWICQKRFQIYHVSPNAWRPFSAARHCKKNGLAYRQELDEVGMTLVTGKVGISTAY